MLDRVIALLLLIQVKTKKARQTEVASAASEDDKDEMIEVCNC